MLMFCPAQSERYYCSMPLNTAVYFEIGENITIITRPEMIRFSKEGPSNLRGVVKNVFFLGSLARYEIHVGDKELITLDDSNPTNLTAKGSDVHIEIVPDSAHVKKS